jgi:hypothetical protein
VLAFSFGVTPLKALRTEEIKMSVSYGATNNYGPAFPTVAVSLAAGTADSVAVTEARCVPEGAKYVFVVNTGRSVMATATALQNRHENK